MSSWQQHRQMDSHQLQLAIKALGLDQAKLGRVLGRSERTMRRYVRGQAMIPPAEVLLIRAMVHFKVRAIVPDWAAEQN